MNYLRLKQIKKLYFGCEDISRVLGITLESARVASVRFVKKGILLRIKRNTYILKDRWDTLAKEDKFIVANLLQVPSYISLMSALDFYEITTQIQRNFIESIAIYRTKETEIGENFFKYTKIDKKLYFGFLKEKEFFIATAEKAFLDSFYLMSLKRYSFDTTSIDFSKLNINKIERMIKRYPKRTQELLKSYGYFKETRNI